VVLHAKHDRKEFIGNLSDIEKQLFPRFLKIHRSYLVALDKIDQLDLKNNQVFIEGNVCLVSRKMKSKLLEEMNRIR
jgi:two-component system response regulator AgrA